jgi:hypothetical protein
MTDSDRYLRELRSLLPRHRRRRIIVELRSHLDEGVAAEMAQGVEREEAERRTIARLGSPHRLAAQFKAGANDDATTKLAMTPLVLVDAQGQELGRCSIASAAEFLREPDHSVDLGPVGYFRIVEVRNGDPVFLVAEPAERPEWPYEIVIRKDGIERRRAFIGGECSYSVGDRVKWPPERGQTPVDHEVVAVRPAADERRTAIVIERVA